MLQSCNCCGSFLLSLWTQHSLSLALLLSYRMTLRTHTGLVSTFGRPCLILKHFSRQRIVRRQWHTQNTSSWKMGRSTYERDCSAVWCIWLAQNCLSLLQNSLMKRKCCGDRLHLHIVGVGHSTLSNKKSCYLFLFICQSCVIWYWGKDALEEWRGIDFALVVYVLLKLVVTRPNINLIQCNKSIQNLIFLSLSIVHICVNIFVWI